MTNNQLRQTWQTLFAAIMLLSLCGCDKDALSGLIPSIAEDGKSTAIETIDPNVEADNTAEKALDDEQIAQLLEQWQVHFEATRSALLANDPQQALRIYPELEKTGIELGESVATVYFAILLDVNAAIELALGNREAALESYEEAFSIAVESEMEQMPLVALAVDLGCCYRLNGRLEEAAEVLDAALEDMQEVDADLQSTLVVVDVLYDVYLKLDEKEKALDVLVRGLEVFLPVVDQQFNVVATLSMLAANLSRATGDQDQHRDFVELCQSLDHDFTLDPNIRQQLINANIFVEPVSNPETATSPTSPEEIQIAELEFEEATKRFQQAERSWNAEQARNKKMLTWSNQRSGRMTAQGQQPILLFNLEYDTFIEREYYDARESLQLAKENLDRLRAAR